MAKAKAKSGPFVKVTQQTSLPLHERREMLKKEKEQRAKDKGTTKQDPPNFEVKSKPKAEGPSTPTPDMDQELDLTSVPTTGSSRPSPPPPLRKQCPGLHDIKYTYANDKPPMKVVHRNLDDGVEESSSYTMGKVPRVLPLPGQEHIPLSDSEGDFVPGKDDGAQDEEDEEDEEDEGDKGEDEEEDGEDIDEEGANATDIEQPTDFESGEPPEEDGQCSPASTVLKNPSDSELEEGFAIEYGEPSDLVRPAFQKGTIANRPPNNAQAAPNKQNLPCTRTHVQPAGPYKFFVSFFIISLTNDLLSAQPEPRST
ncbi:hypothetical protein FRC11_010651 [Ceratobasidium sp. 423]|nr:hypothetical protein FRC11_010651 [Ceratobasidium sp. 423]